MPNVLIEFDRSEEEAISTHLMGNHTDLILVEAERFDGALVVQVLATLNAVTIPVLGKLVAERIRANKHVVIKKDGIIVAGLSAENALNVLAEPAK